MAENIAFGFLGIGLPDGMSVFIVSALPFLGIRAGIIISGFMGFGVLRTLVVCVLGSLAPAPFILILFNRLLDAFERRRVLAFAVRRIKRVLSRKNRHARERLVFGLFIFAALPIPLSGVWMSSAVAAALGLDLKASLLAIAAGTLISAVLMLLLALIFPGLFWAI